MTPITTISEVKPPTPPTSDKVLILRFVKDGGLGNQFFEWSAGLNIARRLNIPYRWEWMSSGHREYGLRHFGLEPSPFKDGPEVCPPLGQGNPAILERVIRAVEESPLTECRVRSPFQCEECFIDVADEVRERFRLEPLELDVPEGATPVSVQVRRGDYVKHPRLEVTNRAYFLNGMDMIRLHVEKPHFFVVSDDPPWCKANFAGIPDVTVMPRQSAIEGLRTMAACDCHIISNSTYGWWGAWLNERGPVVAPDRWYTEKGRYGPWEPVPARWLRASTRMPEPFIRVTERTLDRAVVVPWQADSDKWESLRFSIRSVAKFFTDKDCPIHIYGTRRPPWLLEKSGRVRFFDCWTYADALARGVQCAERVLWMNDDIVILKDTSWEDAAVPLHMGDVYPGFDTASRDNPNPWRRGVYRAIRDLEMLNGKRDYKVFSTHTPYVYERGKAVAVFEKYGIWEKMPLEMIYFNLHHLGDAVRCDCRTQDVPFGDARYLNHTDAKLTSAMKQAIADMLPEFDPWELKRPVKI